MTKKQTKSVTGVVRRKPTTQAAQEAIDSGQRRAFEVLDEIKLAFQREAIAQQGNAEQVRQDARRQPRSPR
jgi:hypothetical protein